MKLQPLQLCRLCGSFRRKWQLIALAAALPAALLLPGFFRTAALSLWGLTGSLLLLIALTVFTCLRKKYGAPAPSTDNTQK